MWIILLEQLLVLIQLYQRQYKDNKNLIQFNALFDSRAVKRFVLVYSETISALNFVFLVEILINCLKIAVAHQLHCPISR